MRTRTCSLFGIAHPVVLGGMASGTSPELVAAVSNAGGLGVQGCAGRSPSDITELAQRIRGLTDRPFGLNLLLFMANDAAITIGAILVLLEMIGIGRRHASHPV